MKKTPPLPDYPAFLAALKERILQARTSAVREVNRDLVLLYWDIGRGIVEKQQTAGWGQAVVERLAADLRTEFPDMRGFSADNLWRMRQFFAEYTDAEFLEQAVPELRKLRGEFLEQAVPETDSPTGAISQRHQETTLGQPVQESASAPAAANFPPLSQGVRELAATVPWGHHVELLKKVKDPAARIYYLRATAQLGWSRNVLLNQIKAGAYERAVNEEEDT